MLRRFTLSLLLALVTVLSAKAMSYDEARERAWFLTDKMAYELNLTPEQYDRAYEINLDYLLSLRTAADCYGAYWDATATCAMCFTTGSTAATPRLNTSSARYAGCATRGIIL